MRKRPVSSANPLQGALFEEDFLLRILGEIVRVPDVAITELVANAWDAGASRVEITVPDAIGDPIRVADDGAGLTPAQFATRWMTLGYSRQRHQGAQADAPPDRADLRRRAFGRNGAGRHGLLCFADEYVVETIREGTLSRYTIALSGGSEPFRVKHEHHEKSTGHGTTLSALAQRRVPRADELRTSVAARFLHDPQFSIVVNGSELPLASHDGLVRRDTISVGDRTVDVSTFEGDPARSKHQSGVAFWVSGRLVGEPGWVFGGRRLADGRTHTGRRFTFIVKADSFVDHVAVDWTRFQRSADVDALHAAVEGHVENVLRDLLRTHVAETENEVVAAVVSRIAAVELGAEHHARDLVREMATAHPLLSEKALEAAAEAVIRVRAGSSAHVLIERILSLSDSDHDGINRLLDEWTVRDAVTVLDEVGRRMRTVEAIEKLRSDTTVDELETLHPLVTEARWLFGPEYESASYASNVTLQTVARELFGKTGRFLNARRRPDLIVLPEGSVAITGIDGFDEAGVARMQRVLLIELKRGGFTIKRGEMNQAQGYVEDLHRSDALDGRPFIQAFVVGECLDPHETALRKLGSPTFGEVRALTFAQLVRSANARLFRLRDRVGERYRDLTGRDLVRAAARDPQLGLAIDRHRSSTRPGTIDATAGGSVDTTDPTT